jgi:hypothetical protein
VSAVPDNGQKDLWEITVLDGNGSVGGKAPCREVIGQLQAIDILRVLRQIEARA